EPVRAIHARRTPMNAEDHRILLIRLPANRLHQKALDVPAIGALIGDALHAGQIKVRPKLLVHASETALVLAVQVRSIEVIQMAEIAGGIDHHVGLFIDVEAARRSFSGSYRGELAVLNIDAEDA